MNNQQPVSIHWFRRDLRLHDNHALFHALKSNYRVLPIFIFDTNILERLEEKKDARVQFIYESLFSIHQALQEKNAGVLILIGNPIACWKNILSQYNVKEVYTNHDYEPYALQRDEQVAALLNTHNIPFHTFKDQVLFEKEEVVKDDGKPYTVYTPYSRKWLSRLQQTGIPFYDSASLSSNFYSFTSNFPTLEEIGFEKSNIQFPPATCSDAIIRDYAEQRDIPGINGTSRLGLHLRFGTISIRETARKAQQLSASWLNELCWREFYMMILWHFPYVTQSAFKPTYNAIAWRNNETEFQAWCEGKTGYPIVDAGMRELNKTGYMHNRVRMIVASFLTKHLLIDWRWGEAYFASKLLDFDLSANNGGWQWAAGCGCDAAPYFRIFNPYEQTKKFDSDFKYIRKWVPEFQDFSYPQPIVDHKMARERCLATYKSGLGRDL
ncbi:MAG: cryptochrome/photolyase family protein [Bacteroidota bacterium]